MAAIEMGLVIRSALIDRPYAAQFAGKVALLEIGGACALEIVWALASRGRRPRRAGRGALALALAFGLTAALCLLFALANGLPPLFYRGSGGWGTAPSLVAAAAVGLVAAGVRSVLALPLGLPLRGGPGTASRSSSGMADRFRAAVLTEPPLLAFAVLGTYGLLMRRSLHPASLRGILVCSGAALVGLALAAAAQRVLGNLGPRAIRTAFTGVPVAATLAAVVAILVGRAPFPAPVGLLERSGGGAGGPPDVLLIVIDTTRADFAPAPSGTRHPTPAIERLAAEGTRWTNAFSTSCWTVPAHASLFTGLAPFEHGSGWGSPRLRAGIDTLAERFARAGWRTGAISANPWISPEFGFDRGFETFVPGSAGRRPFRPWAAAFLGPVIELRPLFEERVADLFEDASGLAIASEALHFLAIPDPRPAFVFVNLMEPHLPYAPPADALGSLEGTGWDRRSLGRVDQQRWYRDLEPEGARTPREREGLRLLYGAEVAYADWLVGRILERLRESGRLDRTIVALTSDHGENLGQHPPLDHQLGLYDTLIHVPLIVRYPARVPRGAVREELVSLEDVPAALLDWAGAMPGITPRDMASPLSSGAGRDAVFFEYERPVEILELMRDRFRMDPSPWDRSLAGVRTRGAKWIEASDGRHQAFDLVADPGEARNLVLEPGSARSAVASLARRLRAVLATRPATPAQPSKDPISEEAAEKLRSLGYIR